MGTFQEDFVIVIPYKWKDQEELARTKLDEWIKSLPEDKQRLFFKGEHLTNGGVTYFMNWDGSKEGWETSEDCDELRKQFIKKVKEIFDDAEIHYIKPEGDIEGDGYISTEHFEKMNNEELKKRKEEIDREIEKKKEELNKLNKEKANLKTSQ